MSARDQTASTGTRLRDILAPQWLVRSLRFQPAPTPWAAAVRAALAIVTPVSVGMATGYLAPSLIGSIGAVCATNANRGGPYRLRLFRVGLAVLLGATGFFLGGLVHDQGVVTLVVLVAIALVSALASGIGAIASMVSLQFVVFATVGSGLSLDVPFWLPPLAFLGGGSWALVLSLVGWTYHPGTPTRALVADVYRGLADMLNAVGTRRVEQERQELTTAMNTAYDSLLTARSHTGGRDPQIRWLFTLLVEATPAIEASLALVRQGEPVQPYVVRKIRAIGDTIHTGTGAPQLSGITGDSPGMRALRSGLEPVVELLAGRDPGRRYRVIERPSWRERLQRVWQQVTSGPRTLRWAGRLGLCVALAEALPYVVPIERSYWVTLTVAIVLKPDFGSVFARGLQRGVGTVLGVVLGAGVLAVIPYGPVLLPFIAVFAAMLPIAIRRNFALHSAFLTPVIILLIDLVSRGQWQLVQLRLVDTLIGCAIALVAGYLIWPATWRPRVGPRFADTVTDVSGYLRHAFIRDSKGRSPRRRRTYRALSDLRTVFQQALTEPPPASRLAAAWWPAIVALERVTDAVTATVIHADHGGEVPTEQGAELLARAMDDLAAAAHEGRPPAPVTYPDEEALAGVAAEVRTARSVFSGPELDATERTE